MTQPGYQRSQPWTVSLRHSCEFQAQPAGPFCMAHDSVGSDPSLLDKEINRRCRSQRSGRACLDKKTAETKVLDGRDIVSTVATPIHGHTVRYIDARGSPPGKRRPSYEYVHTTPGGLPMIGCGAILRQVLILRVTLRQRFAGGKGKTRAVRCTPFCGALYVRSFSYAICVVPRT